MIFDPNEIDDVNMIKDNTITVLACVPYNEASSEVVASTSNEEGEINSAGHEAAAVELNQNTSEEISSADCISDIISAVAPMSDTESNYSEFADDPDYRPDGNSIATETGKAKKEENIKRERRERRRKADPKAWEKKQNKE